jgi:outer membrane protein
MFNTAIFLRKNMKNRFMVATGLCVSLISFVNATVPTISEVFGDEKVVVNASMAIIDSFAVMGECSQGQKARKEIEAKRDLASQEIQEESKKIEKAKNEYVAKATTMSDAAREKSEKNLLKMERDLKNMISEKEEELKLDMQMATEKLAQELDEGVATLAQEQNVDVVFDKMTGRAVYVSNKFDFTNQAIQTVNKNYEMKLAQNKKNESATKVVENKKAPVAAKVGA